MCGVYTSWGSEYIVGVVPSVIPVLVLVLVGVCLLMGGGELYEWE